ncbi:hypothetical protein ACU5AY_05940 [Rhizobium sp. PAMB 3174]
MARRVEAPSAAVSVSAAVMGPCPEASIGDKPRTLAEERRRWLADRQGFAACRRLNDAKGEAIRALQAQRR